MLNADLLVFFFFLKLRKLFNLLLCRSGKHYKCKKKIIILEEDGEEKEITRVDSYLFQ